jgi:hypothetical protein
MRPASLARATPLLLVVATALPAQDSWPGAGWPVATPASLGLNGAVLDSIDAEIRSGRYGLVDRMLVIRRGRVAYDKR